MCSTPPPSPSKQSKLVLALFKRSKGTLREIVLRHLDDLLNCGPTPVLPNSHNGLNSPAKLTLKKGPSLKQVQH